MKEEDRNFLVAMAVLCVIAVALVVLLILKLSGVSPGLSWWWVLSPVLVPLAIFAAYRVGCLPAVALRKVWNR